MALRIIADRAADSTFHVLDPGAHLVNLQQPEHVPALVAAQVEAVR